MTVGTAEQASVEEAVIAYPAAFGPHVTRMLAAGSGPRHVVLLHGFGARADRWRAVMAGLAAAGFHALAPDLPGHGFAPKGPGLDYRTPAFADGVVDLLERIGPAAVVGTSLGGHVATWAALQRPDLVRAAVLVGATGVVPRRSSATSSAAADVSVDGVRRKLELLLHDHSRITDSWVAEEHLVNSSPGAAEALDAVRAYLQGPIAADLTGERYAALGIPTMIVWGAGDRWIPLEVGERIAALLPRAPFLVLADAGHAPYLERAETFTEEVARFLADPASQPAGRRVR
ncbi:MAG: alpha/beta hydrolase [Frankia sp.]|nr:alpha/beta hydrolase [Frankia sp.]